MSVVKAIVISSFVCLGVGACLGNPSNTYPTWWVDRGIASEQPPSATDPEYLEWSSGNRSIVLQGQVYFVVDKAIEELNAQLGPIGGAGFALSDLRDDSKNPEYRSPILLAQLKFVSAPFYDLFEQIGFEPGRPGWPTSLVINETNGASPDLAPQYPWLNVDIAPYDFEAALVGQLRFLFNWDLSQWLLVDSEHSEAGDGLPDWWEIYYFGDESLQNGIDDSESGMPDGLSNRVELLIGSAPTAGSKSSENSKMRIFRP